MAGSSVILVLGFNDGHVVEVPGVSNEEAEKGLQDLRANMWGASADPRVQIGKRLVVSATGFRYGFIKEQPARPQARVS